MQHTQVRLPRFKTIDEEIRRLERKAEHTTSEDTRAGLRARIEALKERKESIERRPITDRDLDIVSKILSYRFLPASLIVRLIPGARRRIEDRLQFLWLKRYINRFQTVRLVGEFNYYISNDDTLRLLESRRGMAHDDLPWEEVRTNRTANYAQAAQKGEEGKLIFLRHELMVSRFHGMLELVSLLFPDRFKLIAWRQGPALKRYIKVPKIVYDRDLERFRRDPELRERLSHHPDGFCTIGFWDQDTEQWRENSFFYEADRDTMPLADMRRKFRAHHYYCVDHKKHDTSPKRYKEDYGVDRIRAVLVEANSGQRAQRLLEEAGNSATTGQGTPSLLFWFTTSERFESLLDVEEGKVKKRTRKLPKFLREPQIILKPIWASPAYYDWEAHKPTEWFHLLRL